MRETAFLIVSGSRKIEFISASPLGRPVPLRAITGAVRNLVAFDFDFESKLIYFAVSGKRSAIQAIYLNGTGMRVVVGGMYSQSKWSSVFEQRMATGSFFCTSL